MTLEAASTNSAGENSQWWFNTITGEVEFGFVAASSYRIGPFATRDEALVAIETVRRRAAEWAASESSEED
jgi:hypothetical protein